MRDLQLCQKVFAKTHVGQSPASSLMEIEGVQSGSVAMSMQFGRHNVEVEAADIRDFVGEVAVVSSDDNYLTHGGGVSAAIWSQARDRLDVDPAIRAVQQGQRELTTGDVLASLVDSDVPPVLHAITIDFNIGRAIEADQVARLYSNVFDVAESLALPRIVMPLLAARSAGVDPEASLDALFEALILRVSSPLELEITVLVPLDRELLDGFSDRGVAALERAGIAYDRAVGGVPAVSREEAASKLGKDVAQAAGLVDAADITTLLAAVLLYWQAVSADDFREKASARLVSRGRDLRNRLVHTGPDPSAQLAIMSDLLGVCDSILAELSPLESQKASAPVTKSATVSAPNDSHGTSHVRNLHDLLLRRLSQEDLDSEYARLQELGFQGDQVNCLLESCVTQDPVDLLLTHFSGRQLRAILGDYEGVSSPHDSPNRMARRLLVHLGFPRPAHADDPEQIASQIPAIRSAIATLDEHALEGRIASLARSVEYMLRTYIRFMAMGLLQRAPEQWYADHRNASASLPEQFDKLTLGNLVHLIESMGKEIRRSEDALTQERLRDFFGTDSIVWIPGKAHDLVSRRNRWIHGSAEDGADVSLNDRREQASQFCEVAESLLGGLTAGAYPSVVEVQEVRYDLWGRRRVKASTFSGKSEEIFTDQDLRAGEVYLMYSNTNPLCVDPLLVRAGSEVRSSQTSKK